MVDRKTGSRLLFPLMVSIAFMQSLTRQSAVILWNFLLYSFYIGLKFNEKVEKLGND